MNVDLILTYLELTYNWLKYNIPMPWLAFLHSAAAAYVFYLLGQFVLAERLRREGYEIRMWYDEQRRKRRYYIEGNGLEFLGDDYADELLSRYVGSRKEVHDSRNY